VLILLTLGGFMLAAFAILLFGIHDKRRQREVAVRDGMGDPSLAAPPLPAAAPIVPPPLPSAPPSPPIDPPPAASAEGTPVVASTRHGRGSRSVAPRASAALADSDPGSLTVSSYPWAKVSDSGKIICPVTPCNKIPMSAGVHMLTFE